MHLPLNQILLGDCIDHLRSLPDQSVDAVVTDPPYGLGNKDPSPEDIFMYVLGASMLNTGGDFMGRDWQIPSVAVWREVYRVLKPGGYVVSFGGTRTFDLISVGLRMAGFECRDTIAREFPDVELPILQWVQSQGMPKSTDIQHQAALKAGVCLSPEPAPHVIVHSKLIPVHSDEGKARIAVGLAQIQPGDEPVLITGTGKGDASSVRMAMSLSTSTELTSSNTASSWRDIWDVLSEPTRTSITETEIARIIGLKTWNSLVGLTTSDSTTRGKKIRPDGCKCPATTVVTLLSGAVTNRRDIPARSAHDGVTSRKSVDALKGQGSNLKPAWEPILLFRKPLDGTLANNALKHGTGGLNIDATRVRHASAADFEAHKKGVDSIREKGGSRDKSWKNSSDLSGANEVSSNGRWPANVLLSHSDRCVRIGTKEVAPHPQGPARFQKTNGGGFSDAYGNQLANEEPEVIPEWRCDEGCPVAALNEQSGDRPSTLTGRADPNESHDHPGTEMNPNSSFLGERTHLSRVYADGGGAARFFTQFQGEEWECADGCPVKMLDEQSGDRPSNLTGRADPTIVHADPAMPSNKDGFMRGTNLTHTSTAYADSGGASRFFTQFESEYLARSEGRWPSNALWIHSDRCKRVGSKRVKGVTGGTKPPVRKRDVYDEAGGYNAQGAEQPAVKGYAEADGSETVEAWECVHGCPVKALEQQGVEAGVHAAGNKSATTNHTIGDKVYGGAFKPMTNNPDYHADGTSASRFFSQFDGVPFKYVAKANRREAGLGEFEVEHITLKPLSLIRWLVRLVTPKDGVVLDMYCGSGTTCHAAVLEGMHFIGVERDPTSHAEAVRRLEIVLQREQERKEAEDAFAFMMGRDG